MSEKPLEKEVEEKNNETIESEVVDEATHSEPQSTEPTAEEFEPNEDAAEADSEDSQVDEATVLAKITQLETELKDVTNRNLRLQADYDNFRRRTREEKAQERNLRAQELVQDLLPVLDNFKRALDVEVETDEAKGLKQGMEMVQRQLWDAIKKEGVEEVEAMNQPFDPNLHQAVMQDVVEGVAPNTVVEVFQAGFSLNGKVIRPAMVKVSS